MSDREVGTAVIGGGQAGLAVGFHLKRRRLPFVILDEHDRIGDAWRNRWDSLRLFTPGRYNRLPGMRFPGAPSAYPTKDEIADYLEAYARKFELPVQTGARVDTLAKAGTRFRVIGRLVSPHRRERKRRAEAILFVVCECRRRNRDADARELRRKEYSPAAVVPQL
jgi:cation diffusion facilitator CzcD-associated flavoprotein CzcO